ncbi:MAG: dimethylarginine dimethylaminohydrolase family protein [Egibacteraceae bacterium]
MEERDAYGTGTTVAELRRVLLRRPASDGDFLGAGWRPPDPDKLRSQHESLAALLSDLGCDVVVLDAAERLVDACYVHDPMIMTPRGAILLQMRKAVRRPEPALLEPELEALGIPLLGRLGGDAYADGGDKVWLDDRTLVVGHGYRTNAEGIRQVRALLAPFGVDVLGVDLPHYPGPDAVLHLMSVISPLSDGLAAVYEPLAPVLLLELLDQRGIRRVAVDEEEFATQGCNILAVRPGQVVLIRGNDRVRDRLQAVGVTVHTFDGSDICIKGDGGPTCLTQPLWRA